MSAGNNRNNPPRPHELTAAQVVLGGAAPEFFNAFKSALLASLNPEGELEITLAENIVVAQWGLRRCHICETALATRPSSAVPDPLANYNVLPELRQLDSTARRHERSLERNLRLLRELQSEREFRRLVNAPLEDAPLACSAKNRRACAAERAAQLRFEKAAASRPPASAGSPPDGGQTPVPPFRE